MRFFSLILEPDMDSGYILLNINSISTGEIPTKGFEVQVFCIT